jgi:hypothetical protein
MSRGDVVMTGLLSFSLAFRPINSYLRAASVFETDYDQLTAIYGPL